MKEWNYKNLIVWQKAMDVAVKVYHLTENFPKSEQYGLTSQIRRAASSIPANIAEGSRRKSAKDRIHFWTIAYGSGSELESHLELSLRLDYMTKDTLSEVSSLLGEVLKMLNRLTSEGG